MSSELNRRQLVWTTQSDAKKRLDIGDYDAHRYEELLEKWILPSRLAGANRKTLDNAAESLLQVLSSARKFAVLDVPDDAESLSFIWSYVVEPGFRRGCDLLVTSDFDPGEIAESGRAEERFGYARSLECLQHLLRAYRVQHRGAWGWLSEPEYRLVGALSRAGIAVTSRLTVDGTVVDFASPRHRLAVEVDEDPHLDRSSSASRDAALRNAGWEVMRFDWRQVWESPDKVAAAVSEMRERPKDHTAQAGSISTRRPAGEGDLDAEQSKAAFAGEGVVQVLAPAGSGKTRTLVARVRELVDRGVSPESIVCASFNKATRIELHKRLKDEGVSGVEAHTFNSLGLAVVKDAGCKKRTLDRRLSIAHWKFLCRQAQEHAGTECVIEFDRAPEVIGDFKLGQLMLPHEARAAANSDLERTEAELYVLYQEELDRKQQLDFDDQILLSIRRLREDAEFRQRWQAKYEHVLVDEYQDIEPAQELLILLLAAPQNNIFAVGDEDQCIYSWRRAAVERIVELDQQFPGLNRVPLETVYRCPPTVVSSAASLIANNNRRFPKVIRPVKGRASSVDEIEVMRSTSRALGLDTMCNWARSHDPKDVCVLARTNYTVEEAALACAKAGIPFRTDRKFDEVRLHKVEVAVRSYLRLAFRTESLDSSDIDLAFATPSASLPQNAEFKIFREMEAGRPLIEAVEDLEGEDWRVSRIRRRAEFVDSLATEANDAERFVQRLRSKGGLDKHFREEAKARPHQPDHLEVLKRLQIEAQGLTAHDFVLQLDERERLLREGWSKDGMEILTVHGAKGREWEHVFVLGVQEGLLPLAKCSDPEEERRLAYVAMTRAKTKLKLMVLEGDPSRFLYEAGLLPREPAPRQERRKDAREATKSKAATGSGDSSRSAPAKKVQPRERKKWGQRGTRVSKSATFKKERPKSFKATIVPCPEETTCRTCGDILRRGDDSRSATFADGMTTMVHPRCANG